MATVPLTRAKAWAILSQRQDREFNIDLIPECDADITLNIRQVDLESIIINLVTNAYAQLKVCDTNKKIIIKAWKDRDTIKIHVEDSGPGVPPKIEKRFSKPLSAQKKIL